MNREIKFRAWDKNQKKMFTNIQQKDYIDEYDCLMDFGVWLTSQEDWEIEQYIETKDKHKKEIYSGDIIQYDYSDEVSNWCRGEKALVVFSNCAFLGRMKPFDKRTGTNQNMLKDCSDIIEVIGNIHEATKEQKEEWGL